MRLVKQGRNQSVPIAGEVVQKHGSLSLYVTRLISAARLMLGLKLLRVPRMPPSSSTRWFVRVSSDDSASELCGKVEPNHGLIRSVPFVVYGYTIDFFFVVRGSSAVV